MNGDAASSEGEDSSLLAEAARSRRRLIGPLLLALLAARGATTILWLLFVIPCSMDVSFPEGAIAARAWDVATGGSAYLDWRVWPHQFAPYGPLLYYPSGWIARALHAAPHPLDLYAIGRAQSFVSLMAIAALVGAILRRTGASLAWCVLGAGVFLLWEKPLTFTLSYRPDAPQVAFSLLALWIATGGPATAPRAASAFLALSLAMWFKPMSWGMVGALSWWAFASRGPRFAIGALAAFGGANLALAAALNAAMDGRLFLNMVGSLDNGTAPGNLYEFYRSAARVPLAVLLTGIAAAVATLRSPSDTSMPPPARTVALALLASHVMTSLQNLKLGADVNYYLETWALAAICVTPFVRDLWSAVPRSPASSRRREAACWCAILPLALIDAWIGLSHVRQDLSGMRVSWAPTLVSRRMAEIEGPVLATFPYPMLVRPAPPGVLDHAQFGILRNRGLLDDSDLVGRVERREFSVVVLPAEDKLIARPNWFSDRFAEALLENYEPSERITNAILMRPRGRE